MCHEQQKNELYTVPLQGAQPHEVIFNLHFQP